jgi:hypothetical protein
MLAAAVLELLDDDPHAASEKPQAAKMAILIQYVRGLSLPIWT